MRMACPHLGAAVDPGQVELGVAGNCNAGSSDEKWQPCMAMPAEMVQNQFWRLDLYHTFTGDVRDGLWHFACLRWDWDST